MFPWVVVLSAFLVALVFHEVSHGWVAYRLGDPTAKALGRLSLNPLRHIDLVGTVLVPWLLIATHAPIIFGWAKPVPINDQQLGHPKRDLIWVGLAGPAANLALALLTAAAMRLAHLPEGSAWWAVGATVVLINLVLACFNLLPIPPLDGSRVLVGLLPVSAARWVAKVEPFGFLILIALMYVGVINRVLWPLVVGAARLLGVAW
ncbi:MAG: hypothetical protein A3C53_00495 [Omnitrophica WOR_2 bacterium RIFCSPHIGHO2_02_FULL_68_15]|nr:MAG: hypothetical protein A3C53_00495 [Omnitrophica WOR_2 bacterium RIFCSPHIGHO2_02_FULL_68_15]